MKNNSKYRKYFLLFVLLPINLLCLVIFRSNLFKYKAAVILSGSMEPAIYIDDLVFTKSKKNIKVGDIISFYDDNKKMVMHRIVEINGDEIITKGDANNTVDNAIKRNQVVGVYIGRIKHGGEILKFIKSPIGIGFCVILTVFIILYPCRKDKLKKNGDLEEEKEDEQLTKILFIEAIYSLILIGFMIAGYSAKYQTRLDGSSQAIVASWNNGIELLGENTIDFQNGQTNTGTIRFNVTNTSEVSASYNLSIDNISAKLGIELSNEQITMGIRQSDNNFIIKINDVEESFDIATLQTNHNISLNNIDATYEVKNAQEVYTFKDNVSDKTIIAIAVDENNFNYDFIDWGIFQLNDTAERLHTLKISTYEKELPNFDNLELYATFEQID